MEIKEGSIKKMCSFYASDWHLTTMMLPYVAKLAEKDIQVETILEHGIEENIKELISKLNMKSELKQKILNINWNANKNIEEINKGNKAKIILINGRTERIEEINNLLENTLDINQKENITIVNCYKTKDIKNNIEEILNTHSNIINTSGKHNIKDVISF